MCVIASKLQTSKQDLRLSWTMNTSREIKVVKNKQGQTLICNTPVNGEMSVEQLQLAIINYWTGSSPAPV